ncbi:ATP-binding protein [Halocalculus aciditolerans]|uniref:histidine kinase n=1 Tax=Halocalculus aciditolerans TaxID=1383812 RepID=A0A830FEP6_9EURY|nr:ATP-binding protein [Halocalculus aciditolerans]GGL47734.1 ATPase [Halocalculus aciditolerans]
MSQPLGVSADALTDLVFTVDGDGRLVDWNDATATVTGYDADALAARHATDLVADTDGDVAAALDRRRGAVETTLRTAEGEHLPYEFRIDPAGDAAAAVVVGRDASGRPSRDVFDRMTDAFLIVDRHWRITYANDLAASLLDTVEADDTDVEGSHLFDDVPSLEGTVFGRRYREAMETQEPAAFEEFYEPLDAWFDVRVYPTDSGISIYVRDVTDRHEQRDAIENRERVLREMYEIISSRDRSFTEQVEALLALGRDELDVSYGTLSRIDGEDYHFEVVDGAGDLVEAGDVVSLSATNCERTASTQRTLVIGDLPRDAPDLVERAGYTQMNIACYLGAPIFVGDDVYGTFCFYDTQPRTESFSDWEVTLVDLMSRWVSYGIEREQTSERLARQNERLDRFASVLSHDIRNPLNIAIGNVELARETGDDDALESARSALDRIETLVDDLLSLSRAGVSVDDLEPVRLDAAARRAWEHVDTRNATLTVETDRAIVVDESRLTQLLENLFRNSVEHGSPGPPSQARGDAVEHGSTGSRSRAHENSVEHGGSDVTVTVGDLDGGPDDEREHVGTSPSDDPARTDTSSSGDPTRTGFYVADDGPGIPEGERDQVFERGFTTADDGTGFGLAIVEEVAAAHDWTVTVTESESGGARFEFANVEWAAASE